MLSDSQKSIRQYSKFRISFKGDKNFIEVTKEDRDEIIAMVANGIKYVSLGNIFFSVASLSAILPMSNQTRDVILEPNRPSALPMGEKHEQD